MSVAAVMEAAPKRGAGRPSKVAAFRALAIEMLSANREAPTQNIFDAARAGGFDGKRSAFYAMVAETRRLLGVKAPRERFAELAAEAAERRNATERLRRARREERELWESKNDQRIAERRREREQARRRGAEVREERRASLAMLQHHPTAADEESTKLRVLARKWLAGRETTHKSTYAYRGRWRNHLAVVFGDLEPGEVNGRLIRSFVEEKLSRGLESGTVGNSVRTLSALFSDLVDEGIAERNPVLALPRRVKRLFRPSHDPRTTPFIERMEDIGRLRAALTEPLRTMFTVAVMSGIRPGELVALRWEDFRSDLRMMHVQRRYLNGKFDVPKSGKSRTLPLAPALTEVLREWRQSHPDPGLLFKPTGGAPCLYINRHKEAWRAGLEHAGLPRLTFYQATRHTYASQWVLSGQPIEKLSKLLGHSSIVITEIYAHLKPENLIVPDVISFGVRTTDISTLEGGG